jgi:hypothetical protein
MGSKKAPPPPDYSGITAAMQQQTAAAQQMQQQQMDWAKQQFADSSATTDTVVNAALAGRHSWTQWRGRSPALPDCVSAT